VKVEQPDEYEKDSWILNDEEKIKILPKLKEDGNRLYGEKEYEKAVEKYGLGITYLEQLMTKYSFLLVQ
jgi:AH receptor-interacting protein